jgi:hypothetical protein
MKARFSTALLFLSLSSAGCMSLQSGLANHTTVPAVERRIDAALPIGSTRQEIEAWLTEQGIEYKYWDNVIVGPLAGSCSEKDFVPIIEVIIPDTDRPHLVDGNILISFVLGHDGRLTERSVKWIGPDK